MKIIVAAFIGFLIGIFAGLYSASIDNGDFTPVYFNSGDELPVSCTESFKPVVFHRSDGKLFYCKKGEWRETE